MDSSKLPDKRKKMVQMKMMKVTLIPLVSLDADVSLSLTLGSYLRAESEKLEFWYKE